MRKLRNSKFSQNWGFWFVGGNSDSPSSSLEIRCLKKKRIFIFNQDYYWFGPLQTIEIHCCHPQTKNLNLDRIWSYRVFSLGHRYVNRKKNLIDTISSRIYVRRDPLNNPGEFWAPWGLRLDVMPVEMHLKLPKNN